MRLVEPWGRSEQSTARANVGAPRSEGRKVEVRRLVDEDDDPRCRGVRRVRLPSGKRLQSPFVRKSDSGTGRAVLGRRRDGRDRYVARRRVIEVEQIFERARVLVALGEMAASRQETLLDERQERRMVADGV